MPKHYPWTTIVEQLRERPEQWRLLTPMVAVPVSVIDRVRHGRIRALRSDDGIIQARAGVRAWTDAGQEIADVWLRFVPTGKDRHD